MRLSNEEFNKRCNEVFISREGDYYASIEVVEDRVIIHMAELAYGHTMDDPLVWFDYLPDMKERPHALEYLLGQRSDFDD